MKLTKELLTAIQNDNPAILHLLEEAEAVVKKALDVNRANLKEAIYAYIGRQNEKLAEDVFSLLDHGRIPTSIASMEEKCECGGKCSHEKPKSKPKVVNLSAGEADAVLKQFLTLFQ